MISISHWGMFLEPEPGHGANWKQWKDYFYQKQNFGPELK
jgi:hypothetical protein